MSHKCPVCGNKDLYQMESGCQRCLKCNPIKARKKEVKVDKNKRIDVRMTEDRVREIVNDELDERMIDRPPITKTEIDEVTTPNAPTQIDEVSAPGTNLTWREEAKSFGIRTSQRKKVDVLADIEAAKGQPTVASPDISPVE